MYLHELSSFAAAQRLRSSMTQFQYSFSIRARSTSFRALNVVSKSKRSDAIFPRVNDSSLSIS